MRHVNQPNSRVGVVALSRRYIFRNVAHELLEGNSELSVIRRSVSGQVITDVSTQRNSLNFEGRNEAVIQLTNLTHAM